MAVDLHTHTNFSDGSLSPHELVDEANACGLTAIAITDHDEIQANAIAVNYARKYSVNIVPGVEFSIDFPLPGTAHLHLLGLFLDTGNMHLNAVLNDLRSARKKRAYEILNKLNNLGLDLKKDDLEKIAGQGSAGRPHLAQLLMKKNVVNSVWQAFNKYLSKGKPAYVPKKKLKLMQAMDLIHEAKGLAILAHPVSLKFAKYADLEVFLKELKKEGLDGVEAYYATHTAHFTKYVLKAAKRNNLLVSGGSDFHGSVKPDTGLGTGKGNLNIPDDVYFDLKEAAG